MIERHNIEQAINQLLPEQVNGGDEWNCQIAHFTHQAFNGLFGIGNTEAYVVGSFLRRTCYPERTPVYWGKKDQSYDVWRTIWKRFNYRALFDDTYDPPTSDPILFSAMKKLAQGPSDIDVILASSDKMLGEKAERADLRLQQFFPRGYGINYGFKTFRISSGIDVAEFSLANTWRPHLAPFALHAIHESEESKKSSYRFGPHHSNKQNVMVPIVRGQDGWKFDTTHDEQWAIEDALTGPTVIDQPNYTDLIHALVSGLRAIRIECNQPAIVNGQQVPTIAECSANAYRDELKRISNIPVDWENVPDFRIAEIMCEGTVATVTNPQSAYRLMGEMGMSEVFGSDVPALQCRLDLLRSRHTLTDLMSAFDIRRTSLYTNKNTQ